MRSVLTSLKVRKLLNSLKVASQLTRLSMQVLSMVRTSGVTTTKRAWLFLSKSQLKTSYWQAHAHFFMCHLQLLMKNLNQQSWTTLLLQLKNWMRFVIWMLSAMVKVKKHLQLTKNSLRLSVLVKMLNFVRVSLAWQTQTTLVCQPLQNVKLSKKKHSNFQLFQQQRSVHSLKLKKFVPNVWLTVKVNCLKKSMTLFLLKLLMNGSNGKKISTLMSLFTVNLSVTIWLSTSVKTCQVTSSLKMVGYSHTVCVGLNHQSSGVM